MTPNVYTENFIDIFKSVERLASFVEESKVTREKFKIFRIGKIVDLNEDEIERFENESVKEKEIQEKRLAWLDEKKKNEEIETLNRQMEYYKDKIKELEKNLENNNV